MFNSVNEFFQSDLFWSLKDIILGIILLITLFGKYFGKNSKKRALERQASCLKLDIIIAFKKLEYEKSKPKKEQNKKQIELYNLSIQLKEQQLEQIKQTILELDIKKERR